MPVASMASVTMTPSTWPRRAPIAFRSPSSAAPLGDDGGEQHAHHQRGAGEHQHHQGEDAVEQRRQPLADARQRGVAGHDLHALHVRQDGEARLQRRGAGRQLGQEAASPCRAPARRAWCRGRRSLSLERLERGEGHEHAALVGADAGAAEPAVDDVRLAEDQELAAQHAVARRAQDDVARLQWPIELLDQPGLDGEVAAPARSRSGRPNS